MLQVQEKTMYTKSTNMFTLEHRENRDAPALQHSALNFELLWKTVQTDTDYALGVCPPRHMCAVIYVCYVVNALGDHW